MNIYSIYRATNIITEKVYIGFTSNTTERRSLGHKTDSFKHDSRTKFHKAIREYGWNSFVFECLYQSKEECDPRESHTFTVMEDYFIQSHNSIEDGYNVARGGGAYPIMRGEDHPLYGIGHSDLTKQKIKDNHHDVSGSKNPKAKRITIILPNGERYDSFGNLAETCERIGIPCHVITNMLALSKKMLIRGKRKGLQAYYTDSYEDEMITEVEINALLIKEEARKQAVIQNNFRLITCDKCDKKVSVNTYCRWHKNRDVCPT